MREWQKSGFKNLPQDWEISRLDDIATIKKGKQRNKNTLSAIGDFPVINGGVLPSGYLNEWNTQANTITISEGGESCGYVNFIKTKFWNGGHSYSLLDIKENINPRFLYYFLKSRESSIMRLRVGSALPNIQKKDISNLKVFLPSLEEQEKIAEILNLWDTQIAEVQDLIYHKQRLKTGLMQKLLTQSLRFKGFTQDWEIVRLGDLGEIKTGNTPSTSIKEYWNGGDILWVTPSDIGSRRDIFESGRYLTQSGLKKARFLPKGSLLVTCIASIGKNAILGRDGSCNQQINAILPSNKANMIFLYYLVGFYASYIASFAGKSVNTILNKTSFSNLTFSMPPLKEQEKIAEILSVADEEIELLVQKHQALETQKRALMQRLLTGKVRV